MMVEVKILSRRVREEVSDKFMIKKIRLRRTLDEVKDFGVSSAALSRLSLFLNRLVAGSLENPPLVSAIAERRGPDQILRDFEVIFEANESLLNDTLLDIEMNQKSKYGSRSNAQPWSDIKESTLKTFDESNIAKLPQCIAVDPKCRNRLRGSTLDKVVDKIRNSTNSGLKDMVPKGSIKDKYRDKDVLMEEFKLNLPAVPFVRTQEQLKTRVVWGFPIANVIYEGIVFYPLLEYLKTKSWQRALISPQDVDQFATNLVSECSNSGRALLSIDFSNYDTSVKTELQDLAFTYFKSLFQSSYGEQIDIIKERFGSISLVTPDGIVSGKHGIPSGSAFTNVVGSVVQATIALDSGLTKEPEFQILGDDGIYCLQGEDEVSSLINSFKTSGLTVNEDKSFISHEFCVYLQKLYDIYYIERGVKGGIYPVYRALNRIVHPERFINFGEFDLSGKDYFSIRTISILENCKYHPMFEELVKFVLSLDKYNLEFDDISLNKYIKMVEKREGVGGAIRNQYGDNLNGIRSFEAYKLIKRLVSGGPLPSGKV
jgi:hypothetical protein